MRGTGYAIAEIIWWLVVAAGIGFAIAWILRKWFLAGELEEQYATLRSEEEERRDQMDSATQHWESQATRFSTDLKARDADLERAQTRLAALESTTADLDSRLAESRSNAIRLEAKVTDRESTIGALRSDLEACQRTAASQRADRPAEPTERRAEPDLADKDLAIAKVAGIATRTRGAEEAVDDDLKRIHGIGPKLERLLKGMDITSFRQVANFTAEDVQHVTAALEAFPGRIERDDWMSSAAEEHSKKYGVPD